MGVLKRTREAEDYSFPASKQSKIGDYFTANSTSSLQIPTSNQFAALAEVLNDSLGNPGSDAVGGDTDFTGECSTPLLDSMSTKEPCDAPADLLLLTAKTIDYICGVLASLQCKVDNLIAAVSESLSKRPGLKELTLSKEPSSRTPVASQQGASIKKTTVSSLQLHNREGKASYHLVLQTHKICLTVCSFKGHTPSWRTKLLVKRHLSALLGDQAKHTDLTSVELLHNSNQAQRLLLSFGSSKIPSLLFRNKSLINVKGVFPVRVFSNTILTPLFPKFKIPRWHKCSGLSEKRTEINPNKIIFNDLISWTESPIDLKTSSELPLGYDAVRGGLRGFFKDQLATEQHSTKVRLACPRTNLMESITGTTPSSTSSTQSSHPLKTDVLLHKDSPFESMNGRNKHLGPPTNNDTTFTNGSRQNRDNIELAHSHNLISKGNGSVFLDINKSLEQLIEID